MLNASTVDDHSSKSKETKPIGEFGSWVSKYSGTVLETGPRREFRGDHPVVPYRETHVNGRQFEEGSLYLRDTDGGWHLMRPYLLSNPCPTCHAWSVFVFDRVVKSVPDYKSLDHGHSESRPDCLDALVHVELLDIDLENP
jgi:hypothetical protein